LKQEQYYADPSNHFWRVLGYALGMRLLDESYEMRIRILMERGLGLWDVIESCERDGSLDKQIRNHHLHDLSKLSRVYPQLRLVAFNGSKAAQLAAGKVNLRTVVLPSSSSSNTHRAAEAKGLVWAQAIQLAQYR
jgi:hypoxanthine-DNA glycosylase